MCARCRVNQSCIGVADNWSVVQHFLIACYFFSFFVTQYQHYNAVHSATAVMIAFVSLSLSFRKGIYVLLSTPNLPFSAMQCNFFCCVPERVQKRKNKKQISQISRSFYTQRITTAATKHPRRARGPLYRSKALTVCGASALVVWRSFVFSSVLLLRWCECSCDVYLYFLHSAHANITIHMHVNTLHY
jgi:hypothetical protein